MIAVDLITFTEHCFVVLFLKEREYILALIENFQYKSLTITNPYQFGSLDYSRLTVTAQHS